MFKKDRPLGLIVRNRLEAGRDRNMKIALMITSSVCFIIYQSSGGLTVFAYFKDMWHWLMAGDIILTYSLGSMGNINEVPMSKYLDTWMEGDEPAVVDYMFKT